MLSFEILNPDQNEIYIRLEAYDTSVLSRKLILDAINTIGYYENTFIVRGDIPIETDKVQSVCERINNAKELNDFLMRFKYVSS